MTVDASKAPRLMVSRIESVLQEHVPEYCEARTSPEYPLPAPHSEHLIVSRGEAQLDYRDLAGPDVFMVIRYGDTDYTGRQTGDGEVEKYQALTDVGLSIVSRTQAGLDLPTRNGRQLTQGEWERDRAERYRGILLDIATEHIPDGPTIYLCLLESSSAFPPFSIDDEDAYVMGQVGVTVYQNCRVPIPH
jgi:hypothetical protein